MEWKLADAKNRFSELVNLSLAGEPQEISRRGEKVVVIAKAEYDQLTGAMPDFKTVLFGGPSMEGVNLDRPKDEMREIEL